MTKTRRRYSSTRIFINSPDGIQHERTGVTHDDDRDGGEYDEEG